MRPHKAQFREGRVSTLISHLFWFITLCYAIPHGAGIAKQPDGFAVKNSMITMLEADDKFTTGDAVCARYYKKTFEDYYPKRANAFQQSSKKRGWTLQYREPYTIYPLTVPPYTQVPVEAILGEVYMLRPNRKSSDFWGCFVACQDIRKTLEWVLMAKLLRAMHVRVKIIFAFPCPAGMISRTTERHSWMEPETQEEFDDAVKLLNSLEAKIPKLDTMEHAELLLKGRPHEIVGCECFWPTSIEREAAYENLKRKRELQNGILARDYSRKRTKYHRPVSQGPRPARSSATAVSSATTSQGAQLDAEDEMLYFANELDLQIESEEPFPELDPALLPTTSDTMENGLYFPSTPDAPNGNIFPEIIPPSTIQCHDYDYPSFEMGLSASDNAVAQQSTLLQASLTHFDYTDFDNWLMSFSHGSGSSSQSKHGR